MGTAKTLIFRYDNTGYHQKLNFPTFPHHKHEGSEDNIVASPTSTLTDVLDEVEQFVLRRSDLP